MAKDAQRGPSRHPFLSGAVATALASLLVALALVSTGAVSVNVPGTPAHDAPAAIEPAHIEWGGASFDYAGVPAYDGSPSVTLNDGTPFFEDSDFSRGEFEDYAELDALGRCGRAFALVGAATMPPEGAERPSAGGVRPSGWQLARYPWVSGSYLYNRCHLVAWSLAAEGANRQNLITGTRTLNQEGMAPYERAVAAYVKATGNRVLYRVTPVFEGDELVARGVLIEAASYEDRGATLRQCAWCHNVEPGVAIDYATGESKADGAVAEPVPADLKHAYVLNTKTKVVHLPECRQVASIKESNREGTDDPLDELIERGYRPCGNCRP